MVKKVRSAKGEIVDFDLMKIKQQLGDSAAPTNVQARKDFIDQKLRRRMRKIKKQLEEAPLRGKQAPEPKTVKVDKPVSVESAPQSEKIDEVKVEETAPKQTSSKKRKIKRKTTTDKGE